jgi:lipoprotein-releasing system ATP-binding protein
VTAKLVEICNLSKSYSKGGKVIQVLQGANFSIERGEMVSVIGASGAGKSTLLHILGTLDVPDSGTVRYAGKDLGGLSSAQLADFRNKELGFVFQFHHLLGEFTALENVMMPALIRRLPIGQAREMATSALHDVGLSHRLSHRPSELSGGEQQRTALARALVLQPPLLLADEVTGNLDEATGEAIHTLLFELNAKRGITLVVVTHNRSLADRLPRRLLLEEGLLKERPTGDAPGATQAPS